MKMTGFMAGTAAVVFAASGAMAAPVFGTAVDSIGGSPISNQDNIDGDPTTQPSNLPSGAPTIEYYIPLSGSDCTYGVGGCGTGVDFGSGGQTMSMFLEFAPLTELPANYELSVTFEDLDVDGLNDPAGFLESVEFFDQSGTSITGLIDDALDIPPLAPSSTADTQITLPIALGQLNSTPFYARFDFLANAPMEMQNTAEYLRASVDVSEQVNQEIPLPASVLMLLSAIGGFGFLSWRRSTG